MNISRNIFMMCYFLLKRLRVTLRAGQKSTKISRKISSAKELAAEEDKGKLAKAKWIPLGSGGVDASGNIITPLADNVKLYHEVIRKEYTSSAKTSDTSYEYTIKLEEDELVGTEISEMALIDAEGDVIAFSNFLRKGKDETETTFTIEDNY